MQEAKKISSLLHLDPRTKMLILALFSVVVMIDVVDGPAYVVRIIMTFIPVFLVCLEGKIHIAARFTILFIAASLVQSHTQQHIGGISKMLVLFVCFMITQFAPVMITVWYCISTTKISEFMAAMNRMHASQGLSISLAVMMRFFPTLAEEYRSIRDAMKMRGIAFGGGKITKMITYRLIPLLFSSISIGDELSAAAITRGLGAPVRRTNVCEIGFHVYDFLMMIVMSVMTGLYVWFSLRSGLQLL